MLHKSRRFTLARPRSQVAPVVVNVHVDVADGQKAKVYTHTRATVLRSMCEPGAARKQPVGSAWD